MINLKSGLIRCAREKLFTSLNDLSFQKYWKSRSLNGKGKLSAILAGTVFAGLFWCLWQSMTQEIDNQRLILQQNVAFIHNMKMSESTVKAWRNSIHDREFKPIKNISQFISESAVKNNISLTRIEAKNRDVQISPEPLDFNVLLNWLVYLRKEAGVQTTYLDISATEEVGKVRITRLVLTQ